MPKDAQRIVLASRPRGAVTQGNFRLERFDLPEPGEGEVAVRVTHFSLDPYMRGRMDAGKSYSAPIEVGAPMSGAAVGVVIASKARGLAEGDLVTGDMGWTSHAVRPGKALTRLDPGLPPTTALGVLGMPGFTGWHGFNV